MNDNIKSPRHYMGNGVIEAMDALNSMMEGADITNQQAYWWGCAFKYIWRWPWKNGKQDLLKAKQCLEYLIGYMEDEE